MTDLMVEESLDEGHAVADGGNALSCRERQVAMMAILCLKFQERVLQDVILNLGIHYQQLHIVRMTCRHALGHGPLV
jgi:hypothetical protein